VVSALSREVVNFLFDGGAVDIQRRARSAGLGDLEQRAAGAKAVAEAQIVRTSMPWVVRFSPSEPNSTG
jgi:hypothetical protein